MTKEEIAYKETSGIFNEHELGITGLAKSVMEFITPITCTKKIN